MLPISFFNEDLSFHLPHKTRIRHWIKKVIQEESDKKLIQINFIFCSDSYLLQLNQQYLQHDTLTDIITFDHAGQSEQLESDIYISIDRVNENSQHFDVPFFEELKRVMIHGILHLLGYKDKTEDQQQKMREKENQCLNLYEE